MRKNYFLVLLAILFTVNGMAQNIPSYVPKDGLVAWYPFNGNANDYSGNGNDLHPDTNYIYPTPTKDRFGNSNSAYNFNSDKCLLTKKTPNTNGVEFTWSIWIKKNNNDVISSIGLGESNPTSTSGGGFDCYENKPQFICQGINSNVTNSSYTIKKDEWYFFTVTKDKYNNFNIYINGILNSTGNSTYLSYDSTTIMYVNGGFYGIGTINSDVDDIAMWNRILSDQEITALYTSTPVAQNIPSYVPTNGLVGYWPFNGNANDESGNGNHGTVNGATLSADRNGKANSSYSFDGNSNYINVKNSQSLNNSSTAISGWYNLNSLPYSDGYDAKAVIGKWWQYPSVCDSNFNAYLICINKPQNEANPILGAATPFYAGNQYYSKTNIKTNQWYHFVFIHDSKTGSKLYVNGNLENSNNLAGQICNSINDVNIGADINNGSLWRFFNGQLDDIAIYNRALTEQEITALYSGTPATGLASTKVFVDAPASVNQNDTLELSISTETLNTADNVIAFQTDITYDTTRYTFVSNHTVGTLNPKASVDLNTDKKGTIKVGYISTSALQGAGSLLKLKFKANQQVGQGIFGLSQFMYNNTDITSLKNDTVLTLDVTPPSASISLSQNPVRKGDSLLITVKFSETMTDKPAPQVNLAGANTLANSNLTKVNETNYTYWWVVEKGNGAVNVEITSAKDLAGNNLSKATSNTTFTVLPTLFGDIDTNKFIRAYDAALALQYSVGLNPLPTMDPLPWSNWRIAVANVDTVGTITANDAALIVKYSIGKITSFPADAKKRGDAPLANITVTQEANQLVFRTTGTLFAFNVFMKDNFNAFGQPEVKDKNAMIATNITSTKYNVGLASTTPFTENEPFLILPIVTNENVQGMMDIVANAQEKALAYGAAASIATNQNEAMVIYPNPTKDVVTINNAQGKTVKIVDVQGKEVYNAVLPNAKTEISLKALGAKGMYVVHILDANNLPVQTKQIVLE